MPVSARLIPILGVIVILLNASASAAEPPGKVGVYCRLYDVVSSAHKLRETMREMKSAGIDFIIPSGKGTGGNVYWDSKIAPAELVPDRTYMARVVKFAHAEGLKVYPCFCVTTEGGDTKLNVVMQRNPGWAFVSNGARMGYIDPGSVDARRYETSLMTELVAAYDIDGISLDYMRAPNRISYTDTGRAEFLARHGVDLAKITDIGSADLDTEGGKKAASEVAASARAHPIWPEWKNWKRGKLNAFMGEIEAAVHKVRPDLPISSYCWGAHTYTGNFETCQDWKTWIAKGWLDWINPSGYRYTDEEFRKAAALNRANVPKRFPLYITIGVATSHGKLKDADEIRRQMQMSREAGADGVVFFTWESLRAFLPDVSEAIREWQAGPLPRELDR